ncbi:MAG: glycosyl hydrolase [Planctomycetaceae bacterium]|nr:glycosyl hydrolase [Planctomycetaceae bacterium]
MRSTHAVLMVMVLLGALYGHAVARGQDVSRRVDVFVGGTEGYHTFRIPALLVTPDGTLLAICEGRKTSGADHGDVDLVLKRSSDDGRTWGPLEHIYEEGGDREITIGNPCPVVDQQTGVIWLPFTRDNDDVFITSSDDDGQTWKRPQQITSQVKRKNWSWYATGPGNGIQLQKGPHRGRLVIPCDHRIVGIDDRQASSRSHVFFSDDQGKSWKLGGTTAARMNECAVVELADTSLMLNMRSFRGNARRAVSVSDDGGLTWSTPVDDVTLIEPVCQASFIRYTWKLEQEPGRLLFSNPAATDGRHHLTVRLSYDEGKNWPISKVLYEGRASYSSLARLPDGRVGVFYERDEDGWRMTFSSFTLGWLTDGRDELHE